MAHPRFAASGDSCGICQGLNGTEAAPPAHDNCQCQSVDDNDDCEYDYSGSSSHYGPGDYQAIFGAEISVTCADGTPIGESVEIDLGSYAGEPEGLLDYIEEQVQAIANELCAGCPDPVPMV
jgi:hypothetical protein